MTKYFDIKTSIYLDLLRFLCAFIVLVMHSFQVIYKMDFGNHYISHIAHGAVIVFFVLSGYVIAFTTTVKKRTMAEYVVARLSRLYSIFFPAIIVTIICAVITKIINPSFYELYDNGNAIFRYFLGLFYLNEIWFLSAAPRINGVIWSLSFEFWFYVIFGALYFKTKGLKGWILPFLICFFAGPKILLMMVIWFFGFLAYRLPKVAISNSFSWFLVFVFLVLSIFSMIFFSGIPYDLVRYPLIWASQFLTDYIVGFFIAISVWFLPLTKNKVKGSQRVLKVQEKIRTIGDLTFPIYVLHLPLLVVLKSIMPEWVNLNLQFFIIVSSTFLICSFFGMYLESKKKWWTDFFYMYVIQIRNKYNKIRIV